MTRWLFSVIVCLVLTACQKADLDIDAEEEGNVRLVFEATDATRSGIGDYFSKLNIMLFSQDGSKAFDKVKTQLVSDEGFGKFNLTLSPGIYTVVAVGHSSAISATIKSPTDVRFTASNGEKLTDTFCCCTTIEVGEELAEHSLTMYRATAMFRLILTDDDIPPTAVRLKFDYTGGSANFNPTTFEGITKSTQTENRVLEGKTYEVYTFPLFSDKGVLKITVSALAADGTVIRQRVFENVEMFRNKVTNYKGQFFGPDDGNIMQEGIGFTIGNDWEGEEDFEF